MSTHRPSEDQRDTAVVEAIEVLNSLVETEAQVGSQHQPVSQERTLLKRVAIADFQRTPRHGEEWIVRLGAFLTIASFIAQVV